MNNSKMIPRRGRKKGCEIKDEGIEGFSCTMYYDLGRFPKETVDRRVMTDFMRGSGTGVEAFSWGFYLRF